jgi:hypothetical protein
LSPNSIAAPLHQWRSLPGTTQSPEPGGTGGAVLDPQHKGFLPRLVGAFTHKEIPGLSQTYLGQNSGVAVKGLDVENSTREAVNGVDQEDIVVVAIGGGKRRGKPGPVTLRTAHGVREVRNERPALRARVSGKLQALIVGIQSLFRDTEIERSLHGSLQERD